MDKKIPYGLKRHRYEEVEDSFDTSWLSSSIQSPRAIKQQLNLSNLSNFPCLQTSRTAVSVSQSFEDFSFFRNEIRTPRVVKACHDIQTNARPVNKLSQSFFRTKARVVTLKKRTVPENLLLDMVPKKLV
jgi:hypothetical protein